MNIVMDRGKVSKLEDLPQFSVALDGFVQGPQLDTENHRYSFDHHHGCLRFCTTATCMQVWTAIMGGLDPAQYTIFCNDADIDVALSLWLLKNPDRCSEPLVKKIVDAVGLGDMHAGAIPLNGIAKAVEWISAPQTDSLKNGDYHKLSNDGLMTIMESILHRISLYVEGEASAEIADRDSSVTFEIKSNENGWVLVESADPHVYSAIWKAGFDRVVLLRPQEDNSLAISVAKRTEFIDNFPLEKIYQELNKIEPGWGGGSTIGGAPRNADGSRSKLPLKTIVEVVNACIERRKPEVKTSRKKTSTKKKTSKKKTSSKKKSTRKVSSKEKNA